MRGKPAADEPERDTFPALVEKVGEDPARFLALDLTDASSTGTGPGRFIQARIRGIDDLEVVRAWQAIERRLSGREKVLTWLEEREEYLQDHGDRDERSTTQERRDVEPTDSVAQVADDSVPFNQRGGVGHSSLLDYRDDDREDALEDEDAVEDDRDALDRDAARDDHADREYTDRIPRAGAIDDEPDDAPVATDGGEES